MKQTDLHFKMRLSPELKEKIAKAAKDEGRSMNAEIVQRLDISFSPYSPVPLIMKGSGDISGQEQELVGMWRSMDSEARRAFWILARRLADVEPSEI